MKKIKNIALKRIVIYLCCTFLLSSSFFMSYQVPVYAETTYEDLLRDAVYVAGAAAGIFFSGGTLTPALLIPFIEALAGTGFDVYDYVTQDETAGTTTISADFVNLVLQAYKQYQEENGVKFDGTMEPGENGYYCFPDFTCTLYDQLNPDDTIFYNHVIYTDICTYYPCAVLLRNYYRWNSSMYETCGYIVYYNASQDEFFCMQNIYENGEKVSGIIGPADASFLNPKRAHLVRQSSSPYTGDAYFDMLSGYLNIDKNIVITAHSSSIPIYHDLSSLMAGLRSGDFSAAYNYGKVPDCETPAYTGTYDGGDITVATEKLEGIQDKLDEIDKTDKDIYEKLKELLEWLIGNSGGADGSVDLTTTNSWLAKIYAKVSQIFDKLSETVSGASDAVYAKIQESLDEIIVQLKKIKRWTAIDTVVDGVDAIADWLDLIRGVLKDAKEGAGSAVASLSSAVGDSVDLMAKKFPFSIPWDILFFVSALSAEPRVPYFEIPFNIELSALDIKIDYMMKLDFSQLQFLSDLSRLLLSMTYAVGLMKLTFGVTSVGKEE